jgi:hypothetical protein
MEKSDYKQLEKLLGKLGTKIGDRYCIVCNSIFDGYSIGVYTIRGSLSEQATSYSIESAIEKLGTKKYEK